MVKYATNAIGAMLLLNLIQVTESISGSVVPLAMFFGHVMTSHHSEQMSQRSQVSRIALCMAKVKVTQ